MCWRITKFDDSRKINKVLALRMCSGEQSLELIVKIVTKEEKVVLQLAAKAININYCVNQEDFKDVNWAEVIEVATNQGVLGLCFDAIELLPLECHPDMDNLMEWLGQVSYMETSYEQHCESISRLADFYAENGFKMMLLKGYGLSDNWPKQNHRPVGDIDIFLGLENAEPAFGQKDVWKNADKLIHEKLGIEVDNSHSHHSVFEFDGISVENHYDFINAKDHWSSRKFEKLFKQMASEGYLKHPTCKNLYLPTDDFNALFVLKHCSGHYASTDINLRQVLDWLLFVQKHHDSIDWERLYATLSEFGLVKYAGILSAIGVHYFGLPESLFFALEQDTQIVDRVLNDIFSPEFTEREDGSLLSGLWIKPRRFWKNRWKHSLCYSDSFVSGFIWTTYSKLLKPRHFKV